MALQEFAQFRLVGGTSLSLQLGHRESIDIDLFTDAPYGSIDFDSIDRSLRQNYSYVESTAGEIGMGRSYFIGDNENDSVKLDIYYTDTFIRPIDEINGIRMASIEEIIAMKVEVISGEGRKKDFWDIYEMMESFTFKQMLILHSERYPYGHSRDDIIKKFTSFENADEDFDPVCLRHKHWELIKVDMIDFVGRA
jgi:predicted nucleotidyltransferase component of viral defense system